jgi:hypothetical protein
MTNYTDDTYVSYVPEELKSWLNDNSPYAPDWKLVYQQLVEHGKDMEATKGCFQKKYMMDTGSVYDSDHPSYIMLSKV